MPKGNGATSNRCRLTRVSFWSAWRSLTSTNSMGWRRRWRSSRRTRPAIRARPWPPPPSCTISCACFTRVPAARIVLPAARWWSATRWITWRRACLRSRKALDGTRCSRCASAAEEKPPRCATIYSTFAREASTACFRTGACLSFRRLNRCSKSILRSRCSHWWTALCCQPDCTNAWWTQSKSAIAKPVK